MPPTEPLDQSALSSALHARWERVQVVSETGSTNADLLADLAAPDRSVLVAHSQSAGRGRLSRSWDSPPGCGLTFSVLLHPQPPLLSWGWLPLLAGVALAEAVQGHTGVKVALKWPNDLLDAAGERKLAGILAQTRQDAIVIGIGLNVSTGADELPVPGATSLLLCSGANLDLGPLLVAILQRLDVRYAQWSEHGGDAEACGLAAAYRLACRTIGRKVTVATASGVLRGRASGLDDGGRLLLDVDGVPHAIGAGDVEHMRG